MPCLGHEPGTCPPAGSHRSRDKGNVGICCAVREGKFSYLWAEPVDAPPDPASRQLSLHKGFSSLWQTLPCCFSGLCFPYPAAFILRHVRWVRVAIWLVHQALSAYRDGDLKKWVGSSPWVYLGQESKKFLLSFVCRPEEITASIWCYCLYVSVCVCFTSLKWP